MSTLAELVRRASDLADEDVSHLHALVAEWAMLADLSFADLLLCVRLRDDEDFLVVAQVRPATGPTVYAEDLVGTVVSRWTLASALAEGRIVREGDPEWERGVPVRGEAVPVRTSAAGRIIAVLARDTNLAATRSPSALELAYLESADDLAQMVAEGTFPFGSSPETVDAPRVGDGLVRLDESGTVTYASPNAVSAYRRLGHRGNLTGEVLADVHRRLVGPGLRQHEGVWHAIGRRRPLEGEIEAAGAVVVLRAIPLLPRNRRAALVLVRDVTELRRREAQLLSKDATIREIHHRVKNNLQTVAALLRLQARRVSVPEARVALQESVRRVTSIALVHETLSQTLGETVAFDQVADQLAGMTVDVAATGRRPQVRRTGSFGVLPGTVATPLALVLSELLQNAVEHGAARHIELSARRVDGGLEVVVADDGRGLPPGFSLERVDRLGLHIVRTLVVGELRGTLVMRPGPTSGTEAVVAVPMAA